MPNPAKRPRFIGHTRLFFGLGYLLQELFGTADDQSRYIYLSDGGHFENLGVYELIRRKCKWIIVGDGEQDENYVFNALGGLIRKCETDLGVTVNVNINTIKDRTGPGSEYHKAQFAVGEICYADGSKGRILYIKSSLGGDEPADILQYHYEHPAFPHESTADQFFHESQFESYRKLGRFIARTAAAQERAAILGDII